MVSTVSSLRGGFKVCTVGLGLSAAPHTHTHTHTLVHVPTTQCLTMKHKHTTFETHQELLHKIARN